MKKILNRKPIKQWKYCESCQISYTLDDIQCSVCNSDLITISEKNIQEYQNSSRNTTKTHYLINTTEYKPNHKTVRVKKFCPNCNKNYDVTSDNIKCVICGTVLQQPQTKYQPKCPLCQSTNIQQISLVKRGASGAMFGLFSKTARSQWECKNCGNKF